MSQLSSMTRHAPRQNGLLAALPLGRAVYESGAQLDYAYFPTDCIVSLLSVTKDGSSAEMGRRRRDEKLIRINALRTGHSRKNDCLSLMYDTAQTPRAGAAIVPR